MRRIIYLSALIVTVENVYAQCPQQPQCLKDGIFLPSMPTCNNGSYYLAFEDNFDGNTLDLTKWSPIAGVPRDFNFTQQKAWHQPQNLEVSNGTLKIIAKKLTTPYTGTWVTNWSTNPPTTQTSTFDYTTGELWANQKFFNGKYEIRCRLPNGKGFWSAFWTFGGQRWNEIDVFEIYGDDIDRFTCNVHHDYYGDNCPEDCNFAQNNTADFTQWHVFTCLFDFDKITWQIDGNTVRVFHRFSTITGIPISCGENIGIGTYFQEQSYPIESMNIILNLAIQSGSNEPDANTVFPNTYEIDYIRYYSNDPCPASGTVSSTLPCQDNLEQNGFYINDKLDLVTEVCHQNDIIIKAIPLNPTVCPYGYFLLNYKKELFISVTLCNDNLVPIDVEYTKWIEPGSATSFNLLANYSVFGITVYPNLPSPYIHFYPGQTYRIKIATNRCGWQEYTKYIHIASDVRYINGSNIVSDVYGKYITISNSTVTQPKEIVARDNIRILPNSNLYAGTYRIDANFGCNDMLGRQTDSTNEEVMRMNYMVDENVSNNEKNIDVEINKKTIAETKLSNTGFSVYPNPNKGKFIIELTNKTTESIIEVFDLMGKRVWGKISPENKLEIDISNQPKGIYLVKVVNENKVIIQKIIYD